MSTEPPDHGHGESHSTSRRTVLKGIGAAASTAAVAGSSIGSVSAANSDSNYDTLTNSVEYGLGTESSRHMAGLMMLGAPIAPVTTGLYFSDDLASAGSGLADWLAGQFSETSDPATMETSTYYHLADLRDNFQHLLKQNQNQLELAENNAIADAIYEIAKDLEAGEPKSTAIADARSAVLDYYSTYEANLLRIIESSIMRVVNLRDREAVVYGDNADYSVNVHYQTYGGSNTSAGTHEYSLFTRKMNIDLINGDTIETRALGAGLLSNDNYDGVVAHPYLSTSSGGPDSSPMYSRVSQYSDWDSDSTLKTELRLINRSDTPEVADANLAVDALDSNNPGFTVLRPPENLPLYLDAYINTEIRDRAATLASESATLAEDIYAAYAAGDLDSVQDIVSPFVRAENLALDWEDTGHFGYAAGYAEQLGYSTSLKAEMDVTVFTPDGTDSSGNTVYAEENITGNLLIDDDAWANQRASGDSSLTASDVKPVEFTAGTRYSVPSASSATTTYIANKNGLKPLTGDQEFTINQILDASGNKISSVTTDDSNQQTISTTNLKQRLQDRVDTQQTLESDGSTTGGGGGGGGYPLGLSQNEMGVAAAASAAGLYLLGKGGSGAASVHPALGGN